MSHSKELSIREFKYIQIEDKYANIDQVMRFCGCEDVERELIFFDGGDCFICDGIAIGDGLNECQTGDFILNFDGQYEVVKKSLMEHVFDLSNRMT